MSEAPTVIEPLDSIQDNEENHFTREMVEAVRTDGLPNHRTDPEFESLLTAGSSADDDQLSADIEQDGQIFDPIIMWENPDDGGTPIILDGNRRKRIWWRLRENGKPLPPLKMETIQLPTRFAALRWIVRHQDGRRNWTAEQKAAAILQNNALVAKVKADAAARQNQPLASYEAKGKALAILADFADVSLSTMERTDRNLKTLRKSNNADVLRRCLNPEKQEDRLSLGEGVRTVRFGEKRAAVERRNAKVRDVENPPIPEDQIGRLDTILLADTISGLKSIPSGTVDCIVTSVPYFIVDIKYGNAASNTIMASYKDYLNHFRIAFKEWIRVLKPGGRIILNVDSSNSRDATTDKRHNTYAHFDRLMHRAGGRFYDDIVWYKQQSAGRSGANFGSWASPRKPNLGRQHEYLMIFFKDTAEHDGDEELNDISPDEFQLFRMAHWYIRPEQRKDLDEFGYHPCPYPEELVYRALKLFTRIGDVILDPYCGSGTTCFVAKALRRRFIGIDNEPEYVAGALERLATLDGLSTQEMEAKVKRFTITNECPLCPNCKTELRPRADGYGYGLLPDQSDKQKTRKPAREELLAGERELAAVDAS